MIISGIYKITCLPTGKVYIGNSTNIHVRWGNHKKKLRRGTHPNNYLLRAWQKYGEDSFEFAILEEVESKRLFERERHWMSFFKSYEHDHGYNINTVNDEGLNRLSAEVRQKISAANKGRKFTDEQYQRLCEAQQKRIRTQVDLEHTLEMSRQNVGKKLSESHRLNIQESAAHTALRKSYVITSPEGETYKITGISLFCRQFGLSASQLVKVARGKKKQYKGWICQYA